MGTAIDQKAYLQKYLGGPSDKKKKKKKSVKGKGFKIIDDDLDLSKLRPLEGDELDVFGEGDDAPQIAGIIDERPEDVRKMEQFKTTTKWRVINQDDGFNSNLQIQEIKKDVEEAEKENELIFGKMYSDSEDEKKNDSDLSPPRKQSNKETKKVTSPKRRQNYSDDDFSPPRRQEEKKSKSNSKSYDDHLSPQRRKQKPETQSRTVYQNSDSDLSPPRKNETRKPRVRKPSRWGDFEKDKRPRTSPDNSPKRSKRDSRSPNRKRHKDKSSNRSGSDNSPPRKNQKDKNYDSDLSPPRKTQRNRNNNSDSDLSPPRKSKKDDSRKRNKSPDSDLSPPRKRKGTPERQNSDKYNRNKMEDNYRSKSDKQVPNNRNKTRDEFRRHSKERDSNRKRRDSDSDSADRNKYNKRHRNSDSPPPTNKKMEKTLDGKQAGLQNAVQLRQENEAFRRREEEAFGKMTDEVSGRNAKVVSRKAKRETSEDRQKQNEKAERQKELDEKYKIWGKGLKQMQAQEQRVQEFMHEASKPLARHKDDKDLEHRLKDMERDGDPMLKYIREKKRERGELGPEKPSYKGSFPPNRFNIRPGYRWDGVDRSNGYEKKFFDQQSKRKAQEEEAYKWSTEDL